MFIVQKNTNTLFWGLSYLPNTSNGSREVWLTCTHCPSSPNISLLKDFYEPVLLLSFAQFMDPTPQASDKPWYYSNGRHNLHFKINTVNLKKCQSKQKAQCPALCRTHFYAKSIEKISQFNDALLISKPIYTRAYEPSCLFVCLLKTS